MKPSGTNHIVLDERGRAWIDNTNVKVIEVILEKRGHGLSPEEMHSEHPHLSLAQIHAALSYYYDHQEEYDAEMERQRIWVEELRAQSLDTSILRKKLREMGKIP